MIFRNLKYFFAQGIKGLISNSLMTLASVGTVVASLVLFGVFLLVGMNLNYIGDQIKEQCEINVFLPREMERDEVRKIGSELSELEFVKEARLYTKEERLHNYKEGKNAGKADMIEILDQDNPLRDAYILSLKDVTQSEVVAAAAAKVEGVEEVSNSQDLIEKIIFITNTIRHASIFLLIILVIISLFIISNTIKLGMFARRKEINIMKYVGATNWFIRWPFMIEGMIIGVVGSAVASMIIMFGYGSILPAAQSFMDNILLLETSEITMTIVLGFIAIGVGIGMAGSAMSIRKHLHV